MATEINFFCPENSPQQVAIIQDILETSIDDIDRFLETDGVTGVPSIQPILQLVRDNLLPGVSIPTDREILERIAFQGSSAAAAANNNRKLLNTRISSSTELVAVDEHRTLQASGEDSCDKVDSVDCAFSITSLVVEFMSLFLATLGLGSTGRVVGNIVADRVAGNPAFRSLVIGSAFQEAPSTLQFFQVINAIIADISINGIFNIILAQLDLTQLVLLGASILGQLLGLAVSLATPAGIAIFLAQQLVAAGLLALAVQSVSDNCSCSPPTPSPTPLPSPDPTRSPTPLPTPLPTPVPTPPPTPDPTPVPTPNPTLPPTPLPTPMPSPPTPFPTPMPTVPMMQSVRRTRVTSDPHFITWNGRFSYQGACDMVYVRNDLLEAHVRTSFQDSRRRFSFVSQVALSIGSDVLEVKSDRSFFINGQTPPPSTEVMLLGGLYPLRVSSGAFQVTLSSGQFISISFYRGTITLDMSGNVLDFGNSTGLAGSFMQNVMLSRNGSAMIMGATPSDFANEWKTSSALGDPFLFLSDSNATTPPSMNTTSTVCEEPQPFSASAEARFNAEMACASIPDPAARENCVFDILATDGDMTWALNPGFTEPVQDNNPFCVPTVDSSGANECVTRGGECVWRCNSNENFCIANLCGMSVNMTDVPNSVELGIVGGCSCAIPFPPPSPAPTPFPTLDAPAINEVITCIAVIDESSIGSGTLASQWTTFRQRYPNRPFCLLQPRPNLPRELRIPIAFSNDNNTILAAVNRDSGNRDTASDWFQLCELNRLRASGITNVAIFIDNSGSLRESEVRASRDILEENLATQGITLVAGIVNSRENWISPFLTDFL